MLERLQNIDVSAIGTLLANLPKELGYLVAALAALVAFIIIVRASRARGAAQIEFAELKGRLSVMAELSAQQSAEQARTLNERIDTLARQLSQTLDSTATRLGDNLSEAGRRTSESLSTLNERLALI